MAEDGPGNGPGSGPPPDVSVIMPAYRVERFVGRAIGSALSQEGVTVEAVVVDDASPDGTADAVRAIAASDPRVRLLVNEANSGAGASRNRACAAARGRWCAALDADDAYAPGRLARLVALAEAEGLDALSDLPVFHDLAAGRDASVQLPADGRLERIDLARFLEASVGADEPFDYGMMKPVFRRALVEEGLWRYPEEARHGQDFLAYFHALAAGARFAVLHEARYVFSTRLGERSGTFSPGSATPVNYRAIQRDTEALIARLRSGEIRPEGMAAEATAALLGRRLAKLADLNRRYGWNTLRTGAWRRHWRWLTQDGRNAGALLGFAAARARRRLGMS